MKRLLIKNIKTLLGVADSGVERLRGKEMSSVGTLEDAYLQVEDGIIAGYGVMDDYDFDETIYYVVDATNDLVMPTFCDSHTHLVYPRSREDEYVMRIKGESYESIAEKGGGILNSALALESMSEDNLYHDAMKRVKRCMQTGTGAIEIKSGYGLSVESEMKMLRVIKRIKESVIIPVCSTFLGAHAIPVKYKDNHDGYIDLIINKMLPQIGDEKLADYIDVFCDKGFFTVAQTEKLLEAGARYGLRPKIHANELDVSGGVEVGVKNGALSVDHLERIEQPQIDMLGKSSTVATLLPGAAFFLGLPYAPARKLIDAGATVALASDFNPGSSPSSSMKFIMSLATLKMKMTPEEVLNAATINGAYAMGLGAEMGSISVGKRASFIITDAIPSLSYFTYAYSSDMIFKVFY